MNALEKQLKPYSKAIVSLLKGVVERKSSVWDDLVHYQFEIQEYIAQIGLELIIKKEEGFAFVKQFKDSEDKVIGLTTRRQIGFEASVVLIVLRQSLEEFDSNPTQQGSEKFITDTEIKAELSLFLPEGFNKLKFQRNLSTHINKVVELGFLKEITRKEQETKYQIHRIIKEKVTLDILNDFKTKLESYVESL